MPTWILGNLDLTTRKFLSSYLDTCVISTFMKDIYLECTTAETGQPNQSALHQAINVKATFREAEAVPFPPLEIEKEVKNLICVASVAPFENREVMGS